MMQQMSKREKALSQWVEGRLNDRKAIEWAAGIVRATHDRRGGSPTNLLRDLADNAARTNDLEPPFKTVWRLISEAANESEELEDSYSIVRGYELKDKIKAGHFTHGDVVALVDFIRPRLRVEPPASWSIARATDERNPLRWVHWDFKARSRSMFHNTTFLSGADFEVLTSEMLRDLVERATIALEVSLQQAKDLGWMGEALDIPSSTVKSVVNPPDQPGVVDEEEHDPDLHEDGFVPLIRHVTTAFQVLAARNERQLARSCSTRWIGRPGRLMQRLVAFAHWFPDVHTPQDVFSYLSDLSDRAFWDTECPEIATLRAKRWHDMSEDMREILARRLEAGPPVIDNGEADENRERWAYRRDYEIARIVDLDRDVPNLFKETIKHRRQIDIEFPKYVPPIEIARSMVSSWSRGNDGDASMFSGLAGLPLLAALATPAVNRGFFNDDDNARAYASSRSGQQSILHALKLAAPTDLGYETGWSLLLSYPPNKADQKGGDREFVEAIAALALNQPDEWFQSHCDKLAYWLDPAEEVHRNFDGSATLWLEILPFAAAEANEKREDQSDLTSAALNEPLGHLISFYLRRCPTIDAKDKTQALPEPMTERLKRVEGRAALLLANRLALAMNYFASIDRRWVEVAVVERLLAGGKESDQLWEAFAKYGRIPPPELWDVLSPKLIDLITTGTLAPEGLRRLVEMAVIVWAWSKRGTKYKFKSVALRGALSLGSDHVRSEAASQFELFFDHRPESEQEQPWPQLGKPFLNEVWPQEPMLQSASTAKQMAAIPAQVGLIDFKEAVEMIMPYLRPFTVWSIANNFHLDLNKPGSEELVRNFPDEIVDLLSSCIDNSQPHKIFDLAALLDLLVLSRPGLLQDARYRKLRRLA